jgi:hypothetical protein
MTNVCDDKTARATRYERRENAMRFGQKFAYFACGCAFVVIGQVVSGLVVSRATAQTGKKPSAEFDTLTVRSLNVVDTAGRVRARLEVTTRPSAIPVDDVMQVFNRAGVSVSRMGVSADGGDVFVYGNDGKTRAAMGVLSDGGFVSVYGNDGKTRAAMGVLSDGGSVSVDGNDGKTRVLIFLQEHGGGVGVYGNDGKPRATMTVDADGGVVVVEGNDGKPRASVEVNEHGGRMNVYGNDGKLRAGMGVNEYGYGGVATCDNGGYRTGNVP